ncbi:MAG: hypothetical protein RIQ33_1729, partial [Bacteroidota bacterium]
RKKDVEKKLKKKVKKYFEIKIICSYICSPKK